jgi:chorismate mutase/prephenate dehydratase
MGEATLRAVYREIMSGALALEHPLTIGYLGPEATFSHLAARVKFGRSVSYAARDTIADVFKDVEADRVDYGCVPVENSTEGAVNHTLDMFVSSSARICAELDTPIHHNLMARCPFESIRLVYSHAQILGQCRRWLQENLPGVPVCEAPSSTKAASLALSEDGVAAIASELAAELYDLPVLRAHIEDNPDNTTRFMIIGKQHPAATGDDKTSVCFSIKERVGGLYDSLVPFKKHNLALTMIESRPSKRRNWEYLFFVDFLGHESDPDVARALEELEEICDFVRVLGSYPRAAGAV